MNTDENPPTPIAAKMSGAIMGKIWFADANGGHPIITMSKPVKQVAGNLGSFGCENTEREAKHALPKMR